jgi:hypothetical protein
MDAANLSSTYEMRSVLGHGFLNAITFVRGQKVGQVIVRVPPLVPEGHSLLNLGLDKIFQGCFHSNQHPPTGTSPERKHSRPRIDERLVVSVDHCR